MLFHRTMLFAGKHSMRTPCIHIVYILCIFITQNNKTDLSWHSS